MSMMSQQSMVAVSRRAYSIPEVAAMLGLPLRTAYAYVQRGEIPSLRLGGRILVPADAIDVVLGTSVPEQHASEEDGGTR